MTSDDPVPSRSRTELVYLMNSLCTGGAEVGMCRLLDGLDHREYVVTVIALDGHSEDLTDHIPSWIRVVDLRLRSGSGIPTLRELYSSIRTADVVVGSLYHSSMIARIAGILNPNATIITWQHSDQFKTGVRRRTFGWTAQFSDVVLADSEPVAEMLITDLGLDDDLVQAVPIAGIDLDKYTPTVHRESGEVTVGTVGRLSESKNHFLILDIAKEFTESNIQFEIGGDGELYEELQTEIDERSLENVTLHGFVDDVPSFLEDLDIYLQPSRREGLCITVLEAMAAGLPVVGSDVGGIGRNVEGHVSGYLYEPDDVDGFVSGIKVLAADPERRRQFGERGREIVENGFTQEILIHEFENSVRASQDC